MMATRSPRPYVLRCETAGHRCRDRRFATLEAALAAGAIEEAEGCRPLIAHVPDADTYELIYDHADRTVIEAVPTGLVNRQTGEEIAATAGVPYPVAMRHLDRARLRGEVVAVAPHGETTRYHREVKVVNN